METISRSRKHAYLIIAHNNFEILKKQILMIDHIENDIYIHIDKKVKNFNFDYFKGLVKYSNVFFTKRIKVFWGHYSQIQCELILLKKAIKNEYAHYHLLSGVDLPIKTQSYIHSFFEEHKDKEFIHIINNNWDNETNVYEKRIGKYYLFVKNYKSKYFFIKIASKLLDYILVFIQNCLKINRLNQTNIEYKFGANWFSITHSFAEYVISQENWIKKTFSHSICGDEIFLQTLLNNSNFRENLVNKNMRLIDWERGVNSSPYTFKSEDFYEIINSDNLFARKFDTNVDEKIIDKVFLNFFD